MIPDVVEDEVVPRPTLREVFLRVIDDVISANGANHVHVLRAAHGGHLGTKRFGDLNGERSKPTRRTVDQDPVTLPDLASKELEGRGCRDPDRCRLFEGEAGGL